MKTTDPHIVLASASPRRKELFSPFKLNVSICHSDIDESSFQWNVENVGRSACELALLKAKKAQEQYPSSIVIGADTVVVFESEILCKPKDRAEAKTFLKKLSNSTHKVVSGCAIISPDKERFVADTTHVTFFPLRDDDIDAYLTTDIWKDKAAGYAIQGVYGALFVHSIQGCYYNVMGFPLGKLNTLLEEFGISLWKALPHGLSQ